MAAFQDFATGYYSGVANFLEIVGFLVTILGFAATLFLAWRSKRAAEQARDAANLAKQRLTDTANFADLASSIAVFEEIMRLLRQGAWEIALDRLTLLKKSLFIIKANAGGASEADLAVLQGAIQQISQTMDSIEQSRQPSGKPPNVPRINSVLSEEIGRLTILTVSIKNQRAR